MAALRRPGDAVCQYQYIQYGNWKKQKDSTSLLTSSNPQCRSTLVQRLRAGAMETKRVKKEEEEEEMLRGR